MDEETQTLQMGNGLGLVEEVNGGIRLSNGTEEFEDGTEGTDTEEREFGTCVSEAGCESESDFPIYPLLLQ